MHDHGAGDSIEYLKNVIGRVGTRLMQERGLGVDTELQNIFKIVQSIVDEQ